jgi:hypothetical protein
MSLGAVPKKKRAAFLKYRPIPRCYQDRSETEPDAAFVVAATVMIIAIMLTVVVIPMLVEIPVVIVTAVAGAGIAVVVSIFDMPAIAVAVADHAGRGCTSGRHQRASAHIVGALFLIMR